MGLFHRERREGSSDLYGDFDNFANWDWCLVEIGDDLGCDGGGLGSVVVVLEVARVDDFPFLDDACLGNVTPNDVTRSYASH